VDNPAVSHLEGAIDGTRFEYGRLLGTHAGRPIVVRHGFDPLGALADVVFVGEPAP
jgi:hypothetical protein